MSYFKSTKDLIALATESTSITICRPSTQLSPQAFSNLLDFRPKIGDAPDYLTHLRSTKLLDDVLLLTFPIRLYYDYLGTTRPAHNFHLAEYVTKNQELRLQDTSYYLARAALANQLFEYIESCSSSMPVLLARLEDITLEKDMLITDKLNTLARLQ